MSPVLPGNKRVSSWHDVCVSDGGRTWRRGVFVSLCGVSDPRLIKEDQRSCQFERRLDAAVQASSLISGLQEEI